MCKLSSTVSEYRDALINPAKAGIKHTFRCAANLYRALNSAPPIIPRGLRYHAPQGCSSVHWSSSRRDEYEDVCEKTWLWSKIMDFGGFLPVCRISSIHPWELGAKNCTLSAFWSIFFENKIGIFFDQYFFFEKMFSKKYFSENVGNSQISIENRPKSSKIQKKIRNFCEDFGRFSIEIWEFPTFSERYFFEKKNRKKILVEKKFRFFFLII